MSDVSTITEDDGSMTLVNVFTVEPGSQQELVDVLVEATGTMVRMPGFISANIHRSVDGTRVVNYAQWRSDADYQAMHRHPDAAPHMRRAAGLASYDPIVCTVVHVGRA